MTNKVIFDYDFLKRKVVKFLQYDENWNNVIKLLEWENKEYYHHEISHVLTNMYMESIEKRYDNIQERQKVEFMSLDEYIQTWLYITNKK